MEIREDNNCFFVENLITIHNIINYDIIINKLYSNLDKQTNNSNKVNIIDINLSIIKNSKQISSTIRFIDLVGNENPHFTENKDENNFTTPIKT